MLIYLKIEEVLMKTESDSEFRLPLLPYRFRHAGYVMIILGFGAAYLYFRGGRPAFFEIPVFAVVTSYAETRWFVIALTNSLDEIAFLFLLIGLLFIGFSKKKTENHLTNHTRIKALFYSAYITTILWGTAYLTVYGWPIIAVSSFIFAVFLLVNMIMLQILFARFNARKNLPPTNNQVIP